MIKITEELDKLGLQAIKSFNVGSIKIYKKGETDDEKVVCELLGSELSQHKTTEETWDYIKSKLPKD